MLLKLHHENPSARQVERIVQILHDDGVVIYPTDTVYAIAAKLTSRKAFERMCKIKDIRPERAMFSMIAVDLAQVSAYVAQMSNAHFRLLKRNLPGPFTFIVTAGKQLPRHLKQRRKTVGIRVTDHNVTRAILDKLDEPMITTSLRSDDEILEYFTDPQEIYEEYKYRVDCVIDSGAGSLYPSAIVELSGSQDYEILREGKEDIL